MFCKNCGNQLKDGAKFCMNCGAKVDQGEAKPEVPVNAPQPEELEPTAPAPVSEPPRPDPAPAPAPEAPVKAKKKKKKLVPVLIVAAVVAVLAVLVIFNFAKVTNFFAKLFMKPDSYYHFVENRNADVLAQSIADVYSFGLFNNIENDSIKQDYSFKAEIGEDARDYLRNALGIDMSWLKNAALKLTNNKNNGAIAPKLELYLNGESVISADAVFDGSTGSVRIPEFSDKYVSFDLSELFMPKYSYSEPDYYGGYGYDYYDGYDYGYGEYSAYPEARHSAASQALSSFFNSELADAIPDRETIRDLLAKYLKIAFAELDEVEKGRSTLTACGVSNTYTTLEVTIDDKAVERMATAVLKELKKDEKVKKILKDFEKALDEDGIYEGFIESINDALEETDEIEFNDKIKMTVWVGSSGEVVGREITVQPYGSSETIVIKMAMPVKGNKFGAEISYGLKGAEVPYIMLSGSGTVKSKKLTGDFKLSGAYIYYDYEYDDNYYWGYRAIQRTKNIDILKISVENFNTKEVFKGHLKGKFTFEIPEDLLSVMLADAESELVDLIKKTKLIIDADITNKNGSLGIKIEHSNKMFLNLQYSYNTGSADKINKNVDSVSAERYSETVDMDAGLDRITEKLKKAGMPSELVERLIDELKGEPIQQNYDPYYDPWDW